MQVKHLDGNFSRKWNITMPREKSKKRKQEDIHQMKTITSRRRMKSRSLKDRGSQAQVRHIL